MVRGDAGPDTAEGLTTYFKARIRASDQMSTRTSARVLSSPVRESFNGHFGLASWRAASFCLPDYLLGSPSLLAFWAFFGVLIEARQGREQDSKSMSMVIAAIHDQLIRQALKSSSLL